MSKYPLDHPGFLELTSSIVHHNLAQETTIASLVVLLREAMSEMGMEDTEWYPKAEELLQEIAKRHTDFDNLRFGQQHGGHNAGAISPYEDVSTVPIVSSVENEIPMTEEELAAYFNEKLPKKKKKEKTKPLDKMTLEEIEEWEKTQDNSNDIYKIAARVKNLARSDGQAALMPAGEALCNVYTHVLKAFYDFADTLDKETKIKLYQLIQKNENMPGNLISAGVGTKGTKK